MDENTIMLIVWLSLFVIALIAELATDALVSIWFCIGAIVALAVTYIPGMPWWGELIVFLGVSAICLAVIRPIANKLLLRKNSKTNAPAIIGKKGKVTKEITPLDYGEVRIYGVLWTAMLQDGGKTLPVDTVIEVVAIDGNKLIVKRVEE